MATITLRNLPPELLKRLRRKADKEGESLSKTILRILEESLGIRRTREPELHHELDALFGSWTKKEAQTFDRALAEQREIDTERCSMRQKKWQELTRDTLT